MLQSLRLGGPALIWCDRWQEGAAERPALRLRLELDFYSMCANLPIKWILNLLKVRQKRDLSAELRHFSLANRVKARILHGRDQTVLAKRLSKLAILSKSADAPTQIPILQPCDK